MQYMGGTNYAAQSKQSLLKDMATLGSAEFICGDYKQVPILLVADGWAGTF